MRLLIYILIQTLKEIQATRRNVVVLGTTFDPKFVRFESQRKLDMSDAADVLEYF